MHLCSYAIAYLYNHNVSRQLRLFGSQYSVSCVRRNTWGKRYKRRWQFGSGLLSTLSNTLRGTFFVEVPKSYYRGTCDLWQWKKREVSWSEMMRIFARREGEFDVILRRALDCLLLHCHCHGTYSTFLDQLLLSLFYQVLSKIIGFEVPWNASKCNSNSPSPGQGIHPIVRTIQNLDFHLHPLPEQTLPPSYPQINPSSSPKNSRIPTLQLRNSILLSQPKPPLNIIIET